MKKTVSKEVHFCDVCSKPADYPYRCDSCGTEVCYDCRKSTAMVEYNHAVYFSGSGDGLYCAACDAKLTKEGKDKKHAAYRLIRSLRQECEAWGIDFKKRSDAAEQALKRL